MTHWLVTVLKILPNASTFNRFDLIRGLWGVYTVELNEFTPLQRQRHNLLPRVKVTSCLRQRDPWALSEIRIHIPKGKASSASKTTIFEWQPESYWEFYHLSYRALYCTMSGIYWSTHSCGFIFLFLLLSCFYYQFVSLGFNGRSSHPRPFTTSLTSLLSSQSLLLFLYRKVLSNYSCRSDKK